MKDMELSILAQSTNGVLVEIESGLYATDMGANHFVSLIRSTVHVHFELLCECYAYTYVHM